MVLYSLRRNEKNLQHLQDQLEKVDWYVLDDLSTFDLDLNILFAPKLPRK